MKIERTSKQISPKMASPSGGQADPDSRPADPPFVWGQLTPRLLHPAKLAIIEALLWVGEPMSAVGLAAMFEDTDYYPGLLSYHLKGMADVGVLRLVYRRPSRGSHQLFFYFSEPGEASSSDPAYVEKAT